MRTMTNQENQQGRFDALATPKWQRLKLPEGLFPQTGQSADSSYEAVGAANGEVAVSSIRDWQQETARDKVLAGSKQKSLGEKFSAYMQAYANHGLRIHSKQRQGDPVIRISGHLDQAQVNRVDHYQIVVEAGARLTVIMDFTSTPGLAAQHYLLTEVHAKAGSQVKVIRIQRLAEDAAHYQQHVSEVEEGAILEQVDVQLGAGLKALAFESDLHGRNSQSDVHALYYGEDQHQLDLSYTMAHQGKNSNSLILAKGALNGAAQKTFRGNLFFDTGASESKGREAEYVVLLSDTAKSDSIPALLCSEDDVIGEHAASIGRIDVEKLFYLMSRGMDEATAKRVIIKASFEEVIERVPDERLRELIREDVDRRIA